MLNLIKTLFLANIILLTTYNTNVAASTEISNWEIRLTPNNSGNFSSPWIKIDNYKREIPNQYQGYIEYRGSFIYKKKNSIPNDGIYLGRIGDVDAVYINGELIGKTGCFPPHYSYSMETVREYLIPSTFLKEGSNYIYIVSYMEYFVQKGVDLNKIEIGNHNQLQNKKYEEERKWYVSKIALSVLCILLAFLSLLGVQHKGVKTRIFLFLTAVSYFTFGISRSRISFHIFNLVTAYKILSLSAVLGLTSLCLYILNICSQKRKWIYLLFCVPVIFLGSIIPFMNEAITIGNIFNYWFYIEIVFVVSITIIAWTSPCSRWIKFALLFLSLVTINEGLIEWQIYKSIRLLDIGIELFICTIIFTQIIELKKNWLVAKKEAEVNSKLAAIGQMSQMLAHDVRRPFSIIKIFLSELSKRGYDYKYIESSTCQIDQAYNKVDNMLDDILEYSRNKPVEKGICNPQTIITMSIIDSLRLVDNANVSFEYKFENKFNALIDTNKVIRVFTNIIGNALEAMNSKGQIWFYTKDANENNQKMIEFTIGNSGTLIPADKIECVFESFFTSGKKKGTGLGLAITKKVIIEHGGRIFVRSENRKGIDITEFIFTLPSSLEKFEVNSNELFANSLDVYLHLSNTSKKSDLKTCEGINKIKAHCAGISRKLKLAIIDDEALFINSLRTTITEHDELRSLIDIIEFHNGEEALLNLEKTSIDYAIIDVDMGKNNMNGLELGEIINNKYGNIIFIIHSNRSASECKEKAKNIGAAGFIPKPMNLDQLIAFISSHPVSENTDKTT